LLIGASHYSRAEGGDNLPARGGGNLPAGRLLPAQWCLSCVHAQTLNSCKKLRKKLADPSGWRRKGRFRPQQVSQRKSASSSLSTLHHPNRLEALSTAIAFPQPGRRFPALRK